LSFSLKKDRFLTLSSEISLTFYLIYGSIRFKPNTNQTMKAEYGSTEIQRIAIVSKIQLIHWTQVGAIKPLVDARGRGSRRIYRAEAVGESTVGRIC
jgi:hypothetical protein